MITYTGIGRYIQNLVINLPAISAGDSFAVLLGEKNIPLPDIENLKIIKASRNIPVYSMGEQVFLPFEMKGTGADILHYPSFNMPVVNFKPSVVTIHDLIYYLNPAACPSRAAYIYARVMFKIVSRAARKIITDSEYSKNDIIAHLGVDTAKVTAIPNGVGEMFKPEKDGKRRSEVREKYGIKGEYIFYAGSHQPRKNLVRLIEAYSRLKNAHGCALVLTGKVEERRADVYASVERFGVKGRVQFIGEAEEDDLPVLYSMARVFVFPSLFEGFGLPPLEAFACGCPVVSSNVTSLPEVVGDAGIMVDPTDTGAIAGAIDRVLGSETLRSEMREKGFTRAALFSWAACAEKTLAVYRDALDS